MSVPNWTPSKAVKPPRLAVIGEAPGEAEVTARRPFVGASGSLLREYFDKAGIDWNSCFFGNVAQERPAGNKFSEFDWGGPEVTEGLAVLRTDLAAFRPTLILLLGTNALRAACDGGKVSIEAKRGAVLRQPHPWGAMPMLATYHPAAAFRDFRLRFTIAGDIMRLGHMLRQGVPAPPAERYQLDAPPDVAAEALAKLRKQRKPVAIDVEGYPGDLRCVSIAWSTEDALAIAGDTLKEPRLRDAFAAFLADPKVPKIMHNGLYDGFVFGWEPWRLPVAGWIDDTMLAQWELACEFPKALDYCGTVHTWRGPWKGDRHADDRLTLQRYCCRDTTATWEIHREQQHQLAKETESLRHYRFNVRTLQPLLDMELSGIRYDSAGAATRRAELQQQAWALQAELDEVTVTGARGRDTIAEALLGVCMVRVKITDPAEITEAVVRKEWREPLPRILALARQARLTPAERGELSILLKIHRNCESVAFRTYLYTTLKLPKQFKKTPLGPVLSADETALLRLRKKSDHPVIPLALKIRGLNTRIQMLGIHADPDGRIRCAYNPVGQETGRVSCYTSPTGSGYNLTTIPEGDRDLFKADEGCWLGQCDLAGADGWTVAANLAALGAPDMLEDLRAGIKPAKVLVRLQDDPASAKLSRAEMKKSCDLVLKTDIRYPIGKIAQHGTCYLMGARTCANMVFLQSGGEIEATEAQMAAMQALFERRYHPSLWQGAVQRRLRADNSTLGVPSGHRRRFCNWPDKRLTEALAHEPQANTTYATNMALVRCWEDPENMGKDGRRIIQLKHHIHDALLFQFPRNKVAFAKRKIRQWFNNTIVIAGLPIVIPFEGAYGESWGNLKEGML